MTAPLIANRHEKAASYVISRNDGSPLLEIFSNGNAIVYGQVKEYATAAELTRDPDKSEFVVETPTEVVARLDQESGVLYLKQRVWENFPQGFLNLTKMNLLTELMIENQNEDVVAAIANVGALYLTGRLLVYDRL